MAEVSGPELPAGMVKKRNRKAAAEKSKKPQQQVSSSSGGGGGGVSSKGTAPIAALLVMAGVAAGVLGGILKLKFQPSDGESAATMDVEAPTTILDEWLVRALNRRDAGTPNFAHNLTFKQPTLGKNLRQLANQVINKTLPNIGYTQLFVAPDGCLHHSGGKCDAIEGWTDKEFLDEHDPALRILPQLRPEFYCGYTDGAMPPNQDHLDPCPRHVLKAFVAEAQHKGFGLQITHLDNLRTVKKQYIPAIERITGRKVTEKQPMHMFYTTGAQVGSFGWHFDHEYDVLLLGLVGRKRFRVAGYKEKHSPLQVDIVIGPGTALYIPAGYYHNGIGLDPDSLILSISFTISSRGGWVAQP